MSAPKRFTREAIEARVCGNKRRHETCGDARREARRVRGNGHKVEHYRCPFCELWHIGHPPSMETLEALARVMRGLDPNPPEPKERT